MKLKRATFRHIEAEIHNYNETLRAMQTIRDDILHSSPPPDLTRVSECRTDSSVARRATLLADNRLLREMQRITEAIASTYAVAKQVSREALYVKYGLAIGWEPPEQLVMEMGRRSRFDLSARDMAWLLGVDESTFHRHRTGFVYGVAERLGWW